MPLRVPSRASRRWPTHGPRELQPKRLDEGGHRGGLLAPAGIVKKVSGERWTPVVQDAHERAVGNLGRDANHHGGVVVVDGYLYGFSDLILTCLEFATGPSCGAIAAWARVQ